MDKAQLLAMGIDEATADKIVKAFQDAQTKADTGLNAQKGLTDTYLKQLQSLQEKYKDVDVDALKSESDTWKQRYETEVGAKEDAVNKAKHDILLSNLLDGMDFSSDFARKGIEDVLRKKNLKVKDNKFEDIDDIVESIKTEYKDAFIETSADEDVDETDNPIDKKAGKVKNKPKNITGKVKGGKKEKTIDEYLDSIYKDNPYYKR